MLGNNPYQYLTVDEMKSLGDDSMNIDVTRDEKMDVSFRSNQGRDPSFKCLFSLMHCILT